MVDHAQARPACYNGSMNEPAVVQGSVIEPARTIPKEPYSSHGFFNVIRDIVHRGNVYHSEQDMHDALDAIDLHENHQLGPDLQYAVNEGDRAGREDVSQRTPPGGPVLPATAGTQPLDYDKLAAAIVRAQAAQNAPVVTATVTDVPPEDDQDADSAGTVS